MPIIVTDIIFGISIDINFNWVIITSREMVMRMRLLPWVTILAVILAFLACSSNPTGPDGPTSYEKIVIEAYKPMTSLGDPSIDVDLMYDDTNQVPGDTDFSDLRVVMDNLPSGTYYIRVTSSTGADQNYALRLLALAASDSEPTRIDPNTTNATDTPYETDDSNIGKNLIDFGNDNYVVRFLDDNPGDTDWLYFVVP